MRKILIISGAFLAVLLSAAFIGPSFVDWNAYKGDVEAMVEKASGRDITIKGGLSFSVLPSPRLSAEGITIANPPGFSAPHMLEAQRLDLAVALFPLFSGQVDVKELSLIAPELWLEQLEDGRNNWTFSDGDAEGETDNRQSVVINNLRLKNGMMRYRDATSDQLKQLENVNLSVSMASLKGPFVIEGDVRHEGHNLSLAGESGRVDKVRSPISLRATLDGVYKASLNGRITDDGVGVSAIEITSPEITAKGRADIVLGAAPKVTLDFDGIDARRFFGARESAVTTLHVSASQTEDGVRIERAEAELLGGGKLIVSGGLREGRIFDGRLEIEPEAPRAFLNALAPDALKSVDESTFQKASLKTALEATDEGVYLRSLEGRIDDMPFKGDIVYLNRPRPYISAELTAKDVYLVQFLNTETEDQASFLDVDLTALQGFDGLLGISIERLHYLANPTGPIAVTASLNQGELRLDKAELGRGEQGYWRVGGSVKNLGPKPRLDINLSARAATVQRLVDLTGAVPMGHAGNSGPVQLNGAFSGTLMDLGFDMALNAASLKAEARGRLQGLNTRQPRYDVTMDVSHTSFAALLQQFNGAAVDPVENAAPMKINMRLRGGHQDTVAAGQLAAGTKGTATLTLDQKGPGDLSASVKVRAPETVEFIRALGFSFNPASGAAGALNLDMMLNGDGDIYTLSKLSASLGDNAFTGSGNVEMTPGRPLKADIVLEAGRLDFNAVLPKVETGAKAASENNNLRWSQEPLDLAFLDTVDGHLRVNAETIIARAYRIDTAKLHIVSEGRVVDVENLSGKMFGGSARLSGRLDGQGVPSFDVDFAMEDAQVEAAFIAATATAPLTGVMKISGAFEGQGDSQKAIAANLHGSAQITAENGVIRKVNIPRINAQLGQLETVNDFVRLTNAALSGGETQYRSIATALVAENGMITTQNFASDIDGGADVDLQATVNLPEWTVNAQGRFGLKDHPDAPPVGMTMTGNLSAPQVAYQTNALKQYMGVRLGAAVLKGVVKGEGVGLKDLFEGGKQAPQENTVQQNNDTESETQEAPQQDAKNPEEEIKDLLIDIFTKKKKESDPPN